MTVESTQALRLPLLQTGTPLCLDSCWYSSACTRFGAGSNFGRCPYGMGISVYSNYNNHVTFTFNGNTVGYYCANQTALYMDGTQNRIVRVDIWQAWRDGVWSGSTTISVAVADSQDYTYAYARPGLTQFPNTGICADTPLTYMDDVASGLCPTGTSKTLQVNDNGTYSWI